MNATLRSRTGGNPTGALLGIYSLCIAALLGASNEASWAAEGGTNPAQPKAAGDVAPVRNKNIRILLGQTTITKDSPKGDSLASYWMAYFRSTCEKQLNAEGHGDGNTFKLLLPLSDGEAIAASGTELRFLYCLDDVKGTASLRVSKGDGAFIREFKSSKPYGEDTKVADIYADLNRQAYAWIRNGSRKE